MTEVAEIEVMKAGEIEVTPEMIEAGAIALSNIFDQPFDWLTEERAVRVYLAMQELSPKRD